MMVFLIVLGLIGMVGICLTLRAVTTDGYRQIETRAGYDSRCGTKGTH